MLAILLAAGKGQRMGGPKALLELAGRTATERCHDALTGAGLGGVLVVVSPALAEPVSRLELPGARIVVNPEPERGQTSSLQAALETARPADGRHPDFLFHTVDHPLVGVAEVAALLDAFAARPAGTAIVVPSVDGRRGHPALHAGALAAEFVALPPDAPAHRVLRADPERVHHVLRTDPWLVRDLDTPDDLAEALESLAED